MDDNFLSSPVTPIRWLARHLRWNRTSYFLMSAFSFIIFLIGYVWWPLLKAYIDSYNPQLPFWRQFDWLLLGNFLVMSLLIMANANIKIDLPMFFIGLAGGLVIEAWGTQTWLWSYYTFERPPLWIIPAWPIATLSIDRIYLMIRHKTRNLPDKPFHVAYWLIFIIFLILLLFFVWPYRQHSLTIMAIALCFFLVFTPTNKRAMLIIFIAGSALGYFLERWGTSRLCWTYYTQQTPPFFAVVAHGMAAVAFWRVKEVWLVFQTRWQSQRKKQLGSDPLPRRSQQLDLLD
jgi:hypothetical protein